MDIVVIPDAQVDPKHSVAFLATIGRYIAAKRPDVVINIGDFAELASLSSFDKGTKAYENLRYATDLKHLHKGMETLLKPIWDLQKKQKASKTKIYRPDLKLTLGNHENRINKAIFHDPARLEGIISIKDLKYEEYGWEVFPFLETLIIEDIIFTHYVPSGSMGRATATASALLKNCYMSAVVGHSPGLQIAQAKRGDGRQLTAVIAGSCYEHDMYYFNAQTNRHFRGILHLYEVEKGSFLVKPVSLDHLKKNYRR